jgi:hypothetical protein
MPKTLVRYCLRLALLTCLLSGHAAHSKTITFLGKTADKTDYSATGLSIGNAGFWFAQFNTSSEVSGRPTNENDRNSLPNWALMNFTTDPGDATRTFSLDNGGVKSEGGDPLWNTLTLPDGESGLSGSVVDPQTINNSNNTVNKIVLAGGVPETFVLHIVVDNTNGEHDPANRINARAETPAVDMRVNTSAADFKGTADVYNFLYSGWVAGDFIKIQLNSCDSSKAAGFAGLMFDVVPEPTSVLLILLGAGFAWPAHARFRCGHL